MTMLLDGISVVTPTKGRVQLVQRLLASLQVASSKLPGDVEVIVVDDSTMEEAKVIRRACEAVGATYIRGPREVGRKRNLGAAAASRDIVFFIDSDCVATEQTLKEHVHSHSTATEKVAAVAGPTVFYGSNRLDARLAERSMVYEVFDSPRRFSHVLWATTSNLSVRRDVFISIGGFHESPLTAVGGEDVDFGIKLHSAGYTMVTAPNGVVLHVRSRGWDVLRAVRKLFQYGRADNWLCWEHPEFRTFHPNPITLALLSSVAGAAARLGSRRTSKLVGLVFSAVWVKELVRRRALRADDWLLDVVAIPLDWSYDAGVLAGAFRAWRPLDALTRFDYQPKAWFCRPESEQT